jgi:hypothetical protein
MKENKYYTPLNFWLPIGYVFAVGLFFHEESRSTRVLHRDQTDEWKGWTLISNNIVSSDLGKTNDLVLFFRLDATCYFDLPFHRGESGHPAVHANARSSL